jgi:hypothetical protein
MAGYGGDAISIASLALQPKELTSYNQAWNEVTHNGQLPQVTGVAVRDLFTSTFLVSYAHGISLYFILSMSLLIILSVF